MTIAAPDYQTLNAPPQSADCGAATGGGLWPTAMRCMVQEQAITAARNML
jgi:hypothetical protein